MRKRSGQSTYEFIAVVGVLVVPLVLLIIDACFLLNGSFTNHKLCKEACRLAASVDPSKSQQEVDNLVDAFNAPWKDSDHKNIIYSCESCKPGSPTAIQQPASGHGQLQGDVTVVTLATIAPPFILGRFMENNAYVLRTEETMSYTYQVP